MSRNNKSFLTPNREIESASRLYLQHWMCVSELGFLVHQSVPIDKEDLKVIDIACGTGQWLLELSKQVSESAQLQGVDISGTHFPPKEWLPANVSLEVLDVASPFPEEMIEQFDILHVSRIVLYIHNEDPSALIENLMSLLKPGGYFCWDELDIGSMKPQAINSSIKHTYCDKVQELGTSWFKQHGITSEWVEKLDEIFMSHDLEVIDFKRHPISDAMAKPWTIMQLMANKDFVENDLIPSVAAKGVGPGNSGTWTESVQNMILECRKGIKITTDIVYVIGRK